MNGKGFKVIPRRRDDEMKIKDWKDANVKKTAHKVDVRSLYDKDTAQAVHILLKPGESLLPHITPVDVFFYILEGEATITVGEETASVGPDHLIESPADILHKVANNGDKVMRFLVVKAPRPLKASKIL